MDFGTLLADLPTKTGSIYVYDRGKVICHPYKELARDVEAARQALAAWGVTPGRRVGIFAPNSYRWLVYDLALIALRATSVAFTEDFAGKIDDGLLERYEIALLLLSKSNAKLDPQKPPHVVFIDAENDHVAAIARPLRPDADVADQLTMVFSSGSAGGLKGLVISRRGVESTLPPIIEAIGAGRNDRLMLFLPMSNFQQRNMCYGGLLYDYDVVISDYLQLQPAMKAARPTILVAPPVYFQMLHTKFSNFPTGRRLLLTGLGKLIGLLPHRDLRRFLARHVFAEFHRQFGGRMRLLITGMAPIKHSVKGFFDLIQLPLSESYGMVEAGSLTYHGPTARKRGSVGKPLPGVNIILAEDGEVIVRRERFLTSRYFQAAEGENERTFIGEGKVATGDIGHFDKDGYLYLRGRKKELIVTPGGYKIHPEVIEGELNDCPDVAQSAVFARRGGNSLIAVVALTQPGPEAEARVRKFANALPSVRKSVPIGEFIFSAEPFTAQNGMLRPNLKLDRRGIAAKFNLSQ